MTVHIQRFDRGQLLFRDHVGVYVGMDKKWKLLFMVYDGAYLGSHIKEMKGNSKWKVTSKPISMYEHVQGESPQQLGI